jgi:hypothetical protein
MKKVLSYQEFLNEQLLLELSSNSTLYHRSPIKLKVGDKIQPKKNKDGQHWLQSSMMEVALEEFRKRNFPDRPSRFSAIYTTPYPRSRFVDKGYLYAVQPIGECFMTDSMLIDELQNQFDRQFYDFDFDRSTELRERVKAGDKSALDDIVWMLPHWEAKKYWEGYSASSRELRQNLEILCEGAIVTEVIDDDRLKFDQDITIESEGLKARMTLFINSRDSKTEMSKEEAEKFLESVKKEIFTSDVKVTPKTYTKPGDGVNGSDEYFYDLEGTLKKGAKLKTTFVKNSIYNKSEERNTKYTRIGFNFYLGRKLYKAQDKSPYYSFEASDYMNRSVYDMGKYFRK